MDHTALIYLMDRDGHFVAPFNLKRTPEEAATDLEAVSLTADCGENQPNRRSHRRAGWSIRPFNSASIAVYARYPVASLCRPLAPALPGRGADGGRSAGRQSAPARRNRRPGATAGGQGGAGSAPPQAWRRRSGARSAAGSSRAPTPTTARRPRPRRRRFRASGTRGAGRTGRTCRASP